MAVHCALVVNLFMSKIHRLILERLSIKVLIFWGLGSLILAMPRHKPGKIKDNFAEYVRFLTESKSVEHDRIKMSPVAGKKSFMGRSAVSYAPVQGDKAFEAGISITDKTSYSFRLFGYWFDDGPCLRFDSKGRPHCNPENGQGLRKRQIRAPHFHKFIENEKVEIAYQTPILGKDGDSIVKDYKLGLSHFCQEARLTCNPSGTPVLEIEQGELDLSSEDPLNGVSF